MKHLIKLAALLVTVLISGIALVACGDDNEDGPTLLEVNPGSVSLVPTANATVSVQIKCSGEWIITQSPEWINLSSTSGKGNTTLTITTLSENATATNRTGSIEIISNELSASISVTQVAALKSGCEVTITDEVILNTSATFRLSFGPNASYFYAGYFPSSSAGWSDAKLVEELEASHNAENAKDGVDMTAPELDEKESYIQCFVAYDAQGNRGEVLRRNFTTPSSANAPQAYISEVKYSSELWMWNTTISATANEYYMAVYTGDIAAAFALYSTPSVLAMIIKDNIDSLTSYVNSTSWKRKREADEMDILITTWAKRGEAWSGVCNTFYGRAKSSNIVAESTMDVPESRNLGETPFGKVIPLYPKDRNAMIKDLKIYKSL